MVKRYNLSVCWPSGEIFIEENDEGKYVEYSDHVAETEDLKTEIEDLVGILEDKIEQIEFLMRANEKYNQTGG